MFATSPAGAVVSYRVVATDPDNTGAQVTIACRPVSGSTFPLGRHGQKKTTVVTCHAHDPADGMPAARYGSRIQIDRIVPLNLGGSNDIANLFPEKANANPGYHVKDKLENKLHHLVCSGAVKLWAVRRQIATNWQALYKKVFGAASV